MSQESPPTRVNPGRIALCASDWRRARSLHRERLALWADDHVRRANRGEKHPVYDFLFTYYSFRPAHALRWSPGADVELLGAREGELDWPLEFVTTNSGYILPSGAFPAHRVTYLRWALRYLENTRDRAATFHCYGLHEWAMVYQQETPRYSTVPLRLSKHEINQVIESSELRCTHYDAYRFFTPQAVPRNRFELSRQRTPEFDQAGCVHVTMDLYKFAHKISPWCPGELIADTFLLALKAREIDMRASPYDLLNYGFKPIAIETKDGRAEYVQAQSDLREAARPLRERLIVVYRELLRNLLINHPN